MAYVSPMQRHILTWLISQVRLAEQQDQWGMFEGDVAWLPEWDTQLGDRGADKALENVWRASMCRSLARLEKRGLITRIKGRKKTRTVRVRLTGVSSSELRLSNHTFNIVLLRTLPI